MMQRILIAALAAALSLGPVRADYVIKDGAGATQTIDAGTVDGKILPKSTPTDSAGNEIAPATQATLAALLAKVTSDPATQTTLAAILAKLSADPATQTTLAALVSANHTDLAAVLAKISSDPATQTTLAAVLAKLTSDPSTATLQGTTNTDLGPPGATACATDTGSCSLNALLQRLAQRLTTVNTTLGTPMQATGGTVQPVAGTSGGCTPYHLAGGTGASNNSTSVKGSAGKLCDLIPINTTATLYYLKIYDSASAPTCSSATNLKHVFPIPASTTGAGFHRSIPVGEDYANGIGFCVVGAGSDTDNSNAATGVYIEASYK